MNIFSRLKRLLKRTLTRANSDPTAASRGIRAHKRALLLTNTLSNRGLLTNRSSMHLVRRTLRRHHTGPTTVGETPSRSQFRRALRRNRVLVVALLAVGGLVALLTGLAVGQAEWAAVLTQGGDLPSARFGAATTYDGAVEQVVLFGGFVGSTSAPGTGVASAPPIVTNAQTYVYRPSSGWQRRDPIHSPSARGYAAMAYDGARKNVVLFGGAPYRAPNAALSGETWIWDGFERDWTLAEPPEPRPDPRQNAVMVYDPHRKVVMMFGGRGLNAAGTALVPLNDTWTWNGSAWTIMPRDGAPSPRHSAAIAYDICNAEAVMFGGIGDPVNNFTPQPGETWIWNGARWAPALVDGKTPLLSPRPRIGASMVTSYRRGGVMLYGGLITTETGQPTAAADTDVWRWHEAVPTGWEKMNSEVTSLLNAPCSAIQIFCGVPPIFASPAPRAYASFSGTGANSDAFNLFGGTPSADVAPAPQVALGDHYMFLEKGIGGGQQGGLYTPDDPQVYLVPGIHTPLNRSCANPVPLPPEDENAIDLAAEARARVRSREGVRDTGQQLPVLTGADWPAANRSTHLSSGNPRPANPNYTLPPECPNRTDGETGANTRLFTDQKRNRVYQFFVCDPDRGQGQSGQLPKVGKMLIEAYDGVTLNALGRVVIGEGSINGVLDLAHDIERGRFYLRHSYGGSPAINELLVLQQDRIEMGADPIVKRIDLTGAPFGFELGNFFIHPRTGKPKVFFAVNPGPAVNTGPPPSQGAPSKLGQWDLEGGREDWRVEIPGCTQASFGSGNRTELKAMRSGDRAYLMCHREADKYAVGRVAITVNADGAETPSAPDAFFGGPTYVTAAWGDPKTERMFLLSSPAAGTALWVFDGKTSRYVGRVGISRQNFGVKVSFDGEITRLYVQLPDFLTPGGSYLEQGGLLMGDVGLTPVPQLLKFPQHASFPGAPTIASLPPGPDAPRRVFIRRAAGNMKKYPDGETVKMPNEMFYRVLADDVPAPEKTDISQLDALTIPVAESPGKTEVSFDAEGSGYGVRLRSVGGIWSAIRPFAQMYQQGGAGEQAEGLPQHNLVRHLIPACVFPDRELMAGFVAQARLSDQDAGARSLGLDVDSNSKIDLRGPFSRCNPTTNASNFPPSARLVFDQLWPLWELVQLEGNKAANPGPVELGKDADGTPDPYPSPLDILENPFSTPFGTLETGKDSEGKPTAKFQSSLGTSWDRHFKEVECVGDALATNTAAVGNIYGSANCVQTQGLVEASARGSAPGVGPLAGEASKQGFSVAEGYSNVVVSRDPLGRGVVVTATAVAKGIQLPGITIGRVTTTAVAWSNGRSSEDPRAEFRREICGVVTPDYSNTKCLSTGEQKQLVDGWNNGWKTNSKMYLPTYDDELYRGSPGGYVAGVIKPVAEEIEDQFFAKDFQKEVPGLVIEFYKDTQSYGPGRQVLMLAAVKAVAGLGVECNSELVYSPQAQDCVAIPDDLLEDEFLDEDEEFFEEEESDLDGEWTDVEAIVDFPESLGSKIGKLLERLPVLRRLPIREMGEALLAASVWALLGLPLLFAWRRLSLMSNMEVGS